MKSVEFCYWLQGYFELTKDNNKLSFDQCQCIKKHLDMVKTYDLDNNNIFTQAQRFCLLLYDLLTPLTPEFALNGFLLKGIKYDLSSVFKHEIDHSYGNPTELNKIHGIYNNNETMRC